ncbi:MAG: pilus assembly protein TadG-related protein, partial [Janthinobacterium lividum]
MYVDGGNSGADPVKARNPIVPRLIREDSGQVLPFAAVIMVVVLAMAGLVLDLGRSLVAHRKLQDST